MKKTKTIQTHLYPEEIELIVDALPNDDDTWQHAALAHLHQYHNEMDMDIAAASANDSFDSVLDDMSFSSNDSAMTDLSDITDRSVRSNQTAESDESEMGWADIRAGAVVGYKEWLARTGVYDPYLIGLRVWNDYRYS
jgi:hypothetical protein